jgi:probable HAF family extracellular repeat protein
MMRRSMLRPSMLRYSLLVSILTILLSISLLSPFATAQSYSVATVGTASPRALNNNSDAAGVFQASRTPPEAHAFLRIKGGVLQDLGTLGGDDSAAFGVNVAGDVVGQANSSSGAPDQAFFWTKSAGMISLGSLGGPSSVANAVNASGQVAGQSDLATGYTHAFLWTQSGGLQNLGILPGGQQSGANAINASGEIAGWANVGSQDDAIIWTQSGGLVGLGINASCGATALGINNSAEVVGWFNQSASCAFTSHGFSWTKGGGLKDLGVLSGGQYSFAYSVNSAGQIVGTGDTSASSIVALLWTADGTLHNLNTLISAKVPRVLVAANAINDAGQIVVDATAKNGTGRFALILTPIMSVALASSENPSKLGQAVTLTATVSSIVGSPADGEQVVFKQGAKILGTATLAGGVASFTTTSLTASKHKIVATYAGDTTYALSNSLPLVQVVTK